jgi:hypothetical protein
MHSAFSRALVVEKETASNDKTAKQQFLVYFVSEVPTASKKFYGSSKKFAMQSS